MNILQTLSTYLTVQHKTLTPLSFLLLSPTLLQENTCSQNELKWELLATISIAVNRNE